MAPTDREGLAALRAAVPEPAPGPRPALAPTSAEQERRLPVEAPLPAGLPACIATLELALRLSELGDALAWSHVDRALRGLRVLTPASLAPKQRRSESMMRRPKRRPEGG